jgi:predicted ATPase
MLTSFAVEKFRSFLDRTEIDLRPLTLLFGENNVGKSALLRVPMLLAPSLRSGGLDSPLDLGGVVCREGSFRDLVSQLQSTPELHFELKWQEEQQLAATVRHLPDLRRQVVSSLRLASGESELSAEWIPERDDRGRLGNRFEVREGAGELVEKPITFDGLVPSDIEDLSPQLSRILSDQRSGLKRIADGIQWLGSLRAAPDRLFKPRGSTPSQLQPDGGGFADVLFYEWAQRGDLYRDVRQWVEEDLGLLLDVEERAEGFVLVLSPLDRLDLRVHLADSGEGIAQVLPVLTALAMGRRKELEGSPRILAMEQPELHLHPKAELALAQRLVRVASFDPAPAMLIETHSENLLLAVQLEIMRKNLSPERVLIYWVERFEDGRSRVRRIEFDDLGQPGAGWPRGVFSEDLELAREIVRLRMERQGH